MAISFRRVRQIALPIAAVMCVNVSAAAGGADDGLVRVQSAHSVSVTLDRLEAALEKAGATVFARIDHAKGAQTVGVAMPANQALIFGNPKIGTDLIVADPAAGLDLPIRVVSYREGGKTWLVYRDPKEFAAQHGLPSNHPKLDVMAGALKKLTTAATSE